MKIFFEIYGRGGSFIIASAKLTLLNNVEYIDIYNNYICTETMITIGNLSSNCFDNKFWE